MARALKGWWLLVIFILLLLTQHIALAQKIASSQQSFQLSAQMLPDHTVNLHWKIADNTWLYKNFIKLHVDYPEEVKLGSINFPPGEVINHPVFGRTTIYKHQLNLKVPLKNIKKHPLIDLDLSYQGCAGDGHCFPPVERDLTVNLVRNSVTISDHGVEEVTMPPGAQKIESEIEGHSLLGMITIFLLLGVLLAFTPCILPTIPILSSIIVGSKQRQSRLTVFLLSLAYVVGIALAYSLLGLLFSSIGASAQAILHSYVVTLLMGGLFALLALSLFGLFEIRVPQALTNRLLNISQFFAGRGYFGAIIMGLLSALIISPCVTAPLIGVLAYIAKTGDIMIGVLALFALGFGMGVPLMAFALLGNKVLPKSGRWMEAVKVALGFLLLAVALWLWQRLASEFLSMVLWSAFIIAVAITVFKFNVIKRKSFAWLINGIAILVLIYGLLLLTGAIMGNRDYLSPLTGKRWHPGGNSYVVVTTEKSLNHYLAKAKKAHKPALIDFYASWCLDCRVMESRVFSQESIQRALSNFIWIKVDVTQETPELIALQKRFKVIGPPAFIFFSSDGNMQSTLSFVGMKSLLEMQRIIAQVS